MSLLASLTTQDDIAAEKDTLGGGSRIRESGIYKFAVALAYLQKSKEDANKGGALGLFLVLKDQAGEYKPTIYLTSGKDKGCKNYYEDKDGKKNYLPGFNLGNSLALLTTGKEISQLDTEDKVVNIYNYDAKADVPTKVACVTEIMGKEIYAAVLKRITDKNVKDASGAYVPSGETREENEIDKFFCAIDGFDKLTSAEIKAKRGGAELPEKTFYAQWQEKNAGKVIDKSTKGAGTPGAPAGAAKAATPAAGKPTNSLFS